MSSFEENFWGDRHNGFDILYHNMKYGQDSSREFSEFLRESCTLEESYAKMLNKLAKYCANSNSAGKGTFHLFWAVLRTLVEKLSNLHQQLVLTWQDLLKEVLRYTEEQHKKHKAVKDAEGPTIDTVQGMQQTVSLLQKAKETYLARCLEYEKLKRENASPKDLEKAEQKYKKATDDYKHLVEKYANIRNEFEVKMTESCQKFQECEEDHLCKMMSFVDIYAKAWEHQHVLLGQIHQEFRRSADSLTISKLMDTFVKCKSTGKEKPGPVEFEEADLTKMPPSMSTPDVEKKEFPITLFPMLEKPKKEGGEENSTQTPCSPENNSKSGITTFRDRSLAIKSSTGWFLSKRRGKEKKKNKDKKKGKDQEKEEPSKSAPAVVDEEGFSIRPDNPQNHHEQDSSSSSDSDSDNEERRSKIKVEIKPFSPNGTTPTGNVDDIKKSIEGLRLSPTTNRRQTPTPSEANMKRSVSVSDSIHKSSFSTAKPSQDLLGLDIFGLSSSSASTPTGYTFPSPQTRDMSSNTTTSAITTPITTPNNTESITVTSSEVASSVPIIHRSQTPTNAPNLPAPPLPRPASRTTSSTLIPQATARPVGRQSPSFGKGMERTDSTPSITSMSFNSTHAPFGSSRGPSPITIGMADDIPLAVAFSETLNAYFKGADDAKCKEKVTGDLMVSFPAGIVKVLTENPCPHTLSFKLKNITSLEHVLCNKQLLSEDTSQSTATERVYVFEMTSLTEHLRRQGEQNKTASYFNIDLLKYQVRSLAGVNSLPLRLTSYWKCEPSQTDYRLDYQYNGSTMASQTPLSNLVVMVPVDGNVTQMQSKPTAHWSSESKRAVWKLGELSSHSDGGGHGCLRAKFDLTAGPSIPSGTAVQFMCEGTTMSGVNFELVGTGYRISLIKRRFITGKYISESDTEIKYV